MMAHNTWLFKLWDIFTWSILLILVGLHYLVTHNDFEIAITSMKARCIVACDLSVIELEHMFLNHELMNALGDISPQYWLEPNREFTFVTHWSLIKIHYCTPKKLGTFGSWFLNHFQGIFFICIHPFSS